MRFAVKLAVQDESHKIIDFLKETAQWLKEKGIKQWSFLLHGGEDEEIKRAIENQATYIVSNEGGMIATFTLSRDKSDWDKHIWGEQDEFGSLYLHRLAIKPSYMKNGLGRDLLTWIETNFKCQAGYLKLDCVADNKKLNHFYREHGFRLVGCNDGHNQYEKKLCQG